MMELQNQLYLMIAVFGGMIALLLVLTVMLAVYVKKTRTLLEDYRMGYVCMIVWGRFRTLSVLNGSFCLVNPQMRHIRAE